MELITQTVGYGLIGVFTGIFMVPQYFFGLFPTIVTIPISVAWLILAFFGFLEARRQKFTLPKSFLRYFLLILASLYLISFLGATFFELITDFNQSIVGIVWVLVFFNIGVLLFAWLKEKQWRLTILSLGTLIILWTLSVAFTGTMAITGAWL